MKYKFVTISLYGYKNSVLINSIVKFILEENKCEIFIGFGWQKLGNKTKKIRKIIKKKNHRDKDIKFVAVLC